MKLTRSDASGVPEQLSVVPVEAMNSTCIEPDTRLVLTNILQLNLFPWVMHGIESTMNLRAGAVNDIARFADRHPVFTVLVVKGRSQS